jgi:hypothetical protein
MMSDWMRSLSRCEKLIAPSTSNRVVCEISSRGGDAAGVGKVSGAEASAGDEAAMGKGASVPRRAVELFCMGVRS